MKITSLKQMRNKVVSFSLAAIMAFSLVFGTAPITVFATSGAADYTFTYDGVSHANEITVNGETIYNSIVAELKEQQASAGLFKKGAYELLINSQSLKEIKNLGATTPDAFNTKFQTLTSLISAIDKNLAIEMTGHTQTAASDSNYEVKLNILGTIITVATYKIDHAILTVTAHSKEIQEGTDIPADLFTYEITGGVNGEVPYTGAPKLTAGTYLNTSAEKSKHNIVPSVGSLVLSNTNYKFQYVNGTLEVIDNLTDVYSFIMPAQNNLTYTAQSQLDAAKAQFIADAKAQLTGNRAQQAILDSISVDNVNVDPADMTDAGTYKLSLNISGEANIDTYTKYNFNFNQSVTIDEVTDVKITVNSVAGNINNNYEVYRTKDIPTVGLNLLGFYVEVPNETSDAAIKEIEDAGLEVTKGAASWGSLTTPLTVDASSLTNFDITVTDGIILDSALLTGIVDEAVSGIVSNVTTPLGLPLDLGSYNKLYDGRALADIEGEDLTEFSNDVLNKVVNALNDAKSSFENSGVSIGSNISIPTINKEVNLGGFNINLEDLYIGEINTIINQINAVLNSANNGISSVESLISTIESFGTSTFALKVTTSDNGLSGTVNAGESTTLSLSLEATFNISLDDLIKLTGINIPGISGLDLVLPIPVSIPLTNLTLGVDQLPVTIYYADAATTFTDNGGIFYPVAPEILEAQLTADHYATVNSISYLLLTDDVKAELGNTVLLTDTATTTLGLNYKVSFAPMSSDKYYGEIAKEITEIANKIEKEIEDLNTEIAQAKEDLDAITDKLSDAYKDAEEKLNDLRDQLLAKEEALKNAAEVIEGILNGKIDTIKDLLDNLEGQIEGLDTSKLKEVLEGYAEKALEAAKDKLKEEAEKILIEILSDPEVRAALVELYQKAFLVVQEIDSQLPITADLGTATKTYDGKEFLMSETGVAAAILTETAKAKTAVEGLKVTTLSDVVLSDVFVDLIPQDLQDTYTKATNLLEKAGVNVADFESEVLGKVNNVDDLKNQLEAALNTEIQKLNGEIGKVEAIVNNANAMSVSELMTALENLNDECEYIKIVVTGDTTNTDSKTVDLKIQVYSTIQTDYELLSLTAELEIEPIKLAVNVKDQTVTGSASISQTEFEIVSNNVPADLEQEAKDSIELVADETTKTITAQIKTGVVNFLLEEANEGVLTRNTETETEDDDDDDDDDSNGGGTTTSTTTGTGTGTGPAAPVVIPGAGDDEEVEIEDQEVPQGDAGDDEEVDIEDAQVPLSSGDSGSPWWILALAALLLGLFLIFFLLKRRKDEEEEEEIA